MRSTWSARYPRVRYPRVKPLLQDVAAANHWNGWGLDNNILCPPTQMSTTQELWCEPGYPGGVEHNSQSWTGVTCTPDGYVICLSLPDWGLHGNVSTILQLKTLTHMQFLNLANNTLTGLDVPCGLSSYASRNCGRSCCHIMSMHDLLL